MPESYAPAVAIILPTFNEAAHIEAVLDTLGRQRRDVVRELLVVDGGSTDATRAIVARVAQRDPRVRLVDNPARLQSAGVNRAAREAAPGIDLLIRADAHAGYPDDFIDALLNAHQATGAQSVVNRLHSVGTGCFQRAVAAVSNSKFGTGGAAHRSGAGSAYVDHGHHALFDRAWFLRLGGYDESFVANEDAEFDTRLRAAGGKVWFTDTAPVTYYPRASLPALARQYYRYGRGRASTRAKHREPLRLRQMIPPILVVLLALSIAGMVLTPWTGLIAFGYLGGVAAATAILLARTRDRCVLGAIAALPAMHIAWGSGFLLRSLSPRSR